jgi:hypothetical protein
VLFFCWPRLDCQGGGPPIGHTLGYKLTVIPSVMNRTRAAVMWMAKKEQGAPRKFFLWQQLNRSSCPGRRHSKSRAESQLLLPSLYTPRGSGGSQKSPDRAMGPLTASTFSSFQLPVNSSPCTFPSPGATKTQRDQVTPSR